MMKHDYIPTHFLIYIPIWFVLTSFPTSTHWNALSISLMGWVIIDGAANLLWIGTIQRIKKRKMNQNIQYYRRTPLKFLAHAVQLQGLLQQQNNKQY